MDSKLSIALLEAFCALGFVVCGVVRRQRFATSALALAALTALFTAIVVQRFGAW